MGDKTWVIDSDDTCKVAKQAQGMFVKDASPVERELIKAIADHDMVLKFAASFQSLTLFLVLFRSCR